MRSGKYTLWDHCFELTGRNLEATRPTQESVAVGQVTHKLNNGSNGQLEVYDYPGGYAQRFDGVDRGGGSRSADLKHVFEDNQRTVRIRMEQEALPGLEIQGASDCRHLTPGHKFTLKRHFDADGSYVLARVEHHFSLGNSYRSGGDLKLDYENRFVASPSALPYRPALLTPKPAIDGVQTAIVVGPQGDEVFCDKYGRVKVQFHWDRLGKKDANSSCWIRVGQMAAGKGFGAVNLPRIGQEVIVAFEDGDPDQPIIVGSVYNDQNMPPYRLPAQRYHSGIVHQSHFGVLQNANEIRFENQMGQERMLLHAETDFHQNVENNQHVRVGKFHSEVIGKKVKWDMGTATIAKSQTGAGSGAGGGPPLPTHEPNRPFDGGHTGPAAAAATDHSPAPPLTPAMGSGAGGGDKDLDAKDDNFAAGGHAKVRFVSNGSDDTIDDHGKTTYVRRGNVTEIYGGSVTRIFKDDAAAVTGSAPAYTTWADPDPTSGPPTGSTVQNEFQAFPYPLPLPNASPGLANYTEVHGGTQTEIWGGTKTYIRDTGASTEIHGDQVETTIRTDARVADVQVINDFLIALAVLTTKLSLSVINLDITESIHLASHAGIKAINDAETNTTIKTPAGTTEESIVHTITSAMISLGM